MSEYQPSIFPEDIFTVRFSTVADGNMMHGPEFDSHEVTERRRRFLARYGFMLSDAHLLKVTYDTEDFCRYGFASAQTQSFAKDHSYLTPPYDALVHDTPGEAVIVPAADCGIMAVFAAGKKSGGEPKAPVFMLSHLGRHSILQKGGQLSIDYLTRETGADMSDLLVYISPAAGKQNYPLEAMNGIGIQEAILEQLFEAGLQPHQVEVSPLDTTTNQNLFSNSEALKGRREVNGRQVVFAALRSQP